MSGREAPLDFTQRSVKQLKRLLRAVTGATSLVIGSPSNHNNTAGAYNCLYWDHHPGGHSSMPAGGLTAATLLRDLPSNRLRVGFGRSDRQGVYLLGAPEMVEEWSLQAIIPIWAAAALLRCWSSQSRDL